MPKYSTKQRKMLLDYLSAHNDQHLTAKAIAEDLKKFEISLSAVYRNLSELENEGQIKRFSKSGSREVYYQYTASEKCCGALHLSCKKCGKTFHMKNDGADRLMNDLEKNDGFTIDKTETVLYGICQKCGG